jgi:hypothetical protein
LAPWLAPVVAARQFGGQQPLIRGETGGADDDRLTLQSADLQVLQRHLGGGEVDQHVAAGHDRVQIVGDEDAERPAAGNQSGIHANQLVPRPLQGAGYGAARLFGGDDDSLTHAAGGTADSYFYH